MRHHFDIVMVAIAISSCVSSCNHDIDQISLGVDDYYRIERMKKLYLSPAYEGTSYSWSLDDSIISTDREFIFISHNEGKYELSFSMTNDDGRFERKITIDVIHEEIEYSPNISKVYEYCPAPGQFINTMPIYEPGDNSETMRQKAENDLKNNIVVSLGAYGGYVTFGFDHTIVNVPDKKDFMITGNSFYSDLPAYAELRGGYSEPGIVMVSFDKNMNGLPDDEWYELAGSEHFKPTTVKNYEITYSRPTPHTPIPDKGFITDTEYIAWRDNQNSTGFLAKNIHHSQSYYPEWLSDDQLTFKGTLLPQNGKDESGMGTYYVLYSYDWGYTDNHPNENIELNSFDIDWAIDSNGEAIKLPGVDFIRVYTGVNQYCNWLGETSTEIAGAQDLHIQQ